MMKAVMKFLKDLFHSMGKGFEMDAKLGASMYHVNPFGED